jgi:hypothetical protein
MMLAPLRHRLQRIAPAPERTIVLLVIFLVAEGTIRYLESRNLPIADRLPVRPSAAILFLASSLYGIARVVHFHPIFQGDYKVWLESTPWTSNKALPMGPVELVWEDGVVVGTMLLLSAVLPEPRAMELLCTFLLSNLLALNVVLWLTRIAAIGYTLCFGIGLALLCWRQPAVCLGVATLFYLIAYEGVRRGLAQFPWQPRKLVRGNTDLMTGQTPDEHCGWPHDRMMREVLEYRRLSRIDALICCMLASWWLVVLSSFIRAENDRAGLLVIPFFAALTISWIGRLVLYVKGYMTPITLWGRIWTFRWVIPGYDYVLIGPFCAFLAGTLSLGALNYFRVPLALCLSVATGVTALVGLILPPRLRRWRLTGRHRIVPDLTQGSTNFVKVG